MSASRHRSLICSRCASVIGLSAFCIGIVDLLHGQTINACLACMFRQRRGPCPVEPGSPLTVSKPALAARPEQPMKVSDFFVGRLHAWGVRRIYGYPGDGINGVLGALQRASSIEFIQVRHEEMAAFMAVAHAKFTGEIGVCLSTGGPGATHMITGLYDAKLDHAPVLAICGQAEATVRGGSYQQELNLDRMFCDVADFVQEASSPAQVRHLTDRAMRIAMARNGVSAIILPKDIQDADYHEPKVAHGFTRSGVGYSRPKIVPEAADIEKAAQVLHAGSKVAILVGAGARGAAREVLDTADLLGAGIAKALLGKDVL